MPWFRDLTAETSKLNRLSRVEAKAAKARRGLDRAQPLQPVIAGFENPAAAVILAARVERQPAAEAEILQMGGDAEPAFAQR